LNSALKVPLGLDIFPRVPKRVKFRCPVLLVTQCSFSHSEHYKVLMKSLSSAADTTNIGWLRSNFSAVGKKHIEIFCNTVHISYLL